MITSAPEKNGAGSTSNKEDALCTRSSIYANIDDQDRYAWCIKQKTVLLQYFALAVLLPRMTTSAPEKMAPVLRVIREMYYAQLLVNIGQNAYFAMSDSKVKVR